MCPKGVCRKTPREALQQAMSKYFSIALCLYHVIWHQWYTFWFKPLFLFHNVTECITIRRHHHMWAPIPVLDHSPCEDCFPKPTRISLAAIWGYVITSHSQQWDHSSWAEPFHIATRTTPCTHTQYLGGKHFPPTDKWTSWSWKLRHIHHPEIKLIHFVDTCPRGHNLFEQERHILEKEKHTRQRDVSGNGSDTGNSCRPAHTQTGTVNCDSWMRQSSSPCWLTPHPTLKLPVSAIQDLQWWQRHLEDIKN